MNKENRVSEAVRVLDIKKSDLARMCNVTRSNVSHWVTRNRIPAAHHVRLRAYLADMIQERGLHPDQASALEESLERALRGTVCPTCGAVS